MFNYLKTTTVFLLVFFPIVSVSAGCPIDVEDNYAIKNLRCETNCENISIRDRLTDEVYYKNDANCIYCDTLIIPGGPAERAYGTLLGDFAHAKTIENNGIYTITFGNHVFEAKWGKEKEWRTIKNLACVKGCQGIKVIQYVLHNQEVLLYDTCQGPNQCSAVLIDNYPACGGGYGVNLSLSKNGEEIYEHPFFNAEDMKDVMPISVKIGDVTLSFDLIKEPSILNMDFKKIKLIGMSLASIFLVK